MQERYGRGNGPIILVHGGAGHSKTGTPRLKAATKALKAIATRGVRMLGGQRSEVSIVEELLVLLEQDPQFNAGFGSALQGDGQARLSAAIMSGKVQKFSGVVLASYLNHPSRLAAHLQGATSRVLGPPGTELLARQLGIAVESPQSAARMEAIAKAYRQKKTGPREFDTVGVVVVGKGGVLAAGTSTGGRGMEFPGRISDSATVAGNYASRYAGVSATGTGEEIVDDALAARIETRCRDGLTLEGACERSFNEARARKRSYGWIAAGPESDWAVCHTTPGMAYAVIDSKGKLLTFS